MRPFRTAGAACACPLLLLVCLTKIGTPPVPFDLRTLPVDPLRCMDTKIRDDIDLRTEVTCDRSVDPGRLLVRIEYLEWIAQATYERDRESTYTNMELRCRPESE